LPATWNLEKRRRSNANSLAPKKHVKLNKLELNIYIIYYSLWGPDNWSI